MICLIVINYWFYFISFVGCKYILYKSQIEPQTTVSCFFTENPRLHKDNTIYPLNNRYGTKQ